MSTFCSLPWIHLATHPDGGTTLCCISDHRNGASRARNLSPVTFLNLNSANINDMINNDFFKKTRLEMLRGEIPNACQRCFDEEANNVRSKRIEENEKFKFTEDMARAITGPDGAIPVNFKFIELRLGNLCNLRCRTCNPNSSTNWIQPYQKLQEELTFITHYDRKIDCSWTESDTFWDDLFEHSKGVELIYINGGEPTLVEKHWKYLEELIKRGLNKQIKLWYNINMTNLPDKLIDLWKEFKQVQISCSIDDLGQRNDYIRAGSDWSTVINNLDKLQSIGLFDVSICQTISWLNVYYVNEFNKFMRNRGLHVHLNYVYDPNFMSLKVLNANLQKHILDKCVDLNQWDYNSLQSQFTESPDYDLLLKGWQYNSKLDLLNKKDFTTTFTDWYEILKGHI